jgi:hypothetical protein
MRRRIIAAVWVAGATVPLLLGTVYFFGCCVLPFHAVLHKLMPVCEMAASAFRAGADPSADPSDDGAVPAPGPEKQQPVKRILGQPSHLFRIAVTVAEGPSVVSSTMASPRSFMTLGATRCDRDVGLHALVQTFLI